MSEPTVFNQDPNATTLSQARTWLDQESRGNKGANCPCCQKPERTRKQKITPVQAALLVLLYRTYKIGDTVNVSEFAASLGNQEIASGRDWGRLVHWDLLEATQNDKVFRLTDGGFFFVFKGHKVTEKAWIRDRDEKIVGWDGKVVDIVKILGDKFDINTLLSQQVPPPAQTNLDLNPA